MQRGIVREESFPEGEGWPESVKTFEDLRCNSGLTNSFYWGVATEDMAKDKNNEKIGGWGWKLMMQFLFMTLKFDDPCAVHSI